MFPEVVTMSQLSQLIQCIGNGSRRGRYLVDPDQRFVFGTAPFPPSKIGQQTTEIADFIAQFELVKKLSARTKERTGPCHQNDCVSAKLLLQLQLIRHWT